MNLQMRSRGVGLFCVGEWTKSLVWLCIKWTSAEADALRDSSAREIVQFARDCETSSFCDKTCCALFVVDLCGGTFFVEHYLHLPSSHCDRFVIIVWQSINLQMEMPGQTHITHAPYSMHAPEARSASAAAQGQQQGISEGEGCASSSS